MAAAARAVISIKAVAVAALHRGPVMVRLGAMGVGFGCLGAVRDLGAGIVIIHTDGLYALGELPLLDGGITLGLDLCLALAIGGLGLLEDVDNVLALGAGSQ
jgi:hypothetical protein